MEQRRGMLNNRVRLLRERSGYSQAELARRVGVTRQALSLVESGQVIPSTVVALRLARVLGASVEDVFFEEPLSEPLRVVSVSGHPMEVGDRVLVLERGGRHVARRVPENGGGYAQIAPAVGVVLECLPDGRVTIAQPPGQSLWPSAVVAGCDIGLGLLAEHAKVRGTRTPPSLNPVWENADNERALRHLADGLANVAAVHFPAARPPVPDVRMGALIRMHFASWSVGWFVKRGNPAGFRHVEDLASGRLRLANRPQGSGVRALLDRLLAEAGVDSAVIPGYTWELPGHLQVAEAVANGLADVGIGIASAAALTKLDFVSIQEEVCELWIPEAELDTHAVQLLCETLQSDVFRWDLERYGPYDVSRTGMQHAGEREKIE
ncbi:substrate-binding domain-containing protein [Alicyclobacillus contaminans]|uniref:substrate-binding domain-containing protein n=1 Tax=Alicyclobacillus contaminans TaxID=392016 RepID=UPI00040D400B|nr:substrate-binding domain-containing protein [Alicyclobacillus contaminans]